MATASRARPRTQIQSSSPTTRESKLFKIRGVSFLSRHTAGTSPDPPNQDPGDPEIYCIALINDASNARISGCWFGLDPNGTTVAGGRSAVAAFKDDGGA